MQLREAKYVNLYVHAAPGSLNLIGIKYFMKKLKSSFVTNAGRQEGGTNMQKKRVISCLERRRVV